MAPAKKPEGQRLRPALETGRTVWRIPLAPEFQTAQLIQGQEKLMITVTFNDWPASTVTTSRPLRVVEVKVVNPPALGVQSAGAVVPAQWSNAAFTKSISPFLSARPVPINTKLLALVPLVGTLVLKFDSATKHGRLILSDIRQGALAASKLPSSINQGPGDCSPLSIFANSWSPLPDPDVKALLNS